jgi:hypothetical protein
MEVESCQTVGCCRCDAKPLHIVTHLVRFLVEFVTVNEKRISRYKLEINDLYTLHTVLRVTASMMCQSIAD